jgi:hypothetical protein
MTRDEAKRLRKTVNEALDAADKLDDKYSMGAINWGDLECTDVEERASLLHGGTLIAVTIEEASPDATSLQAYVGGYLAVHGWKDVLVVTEW